MMQTLTSNDATTGNVSEGGVVDGAAAQLVSFIVSEVVAVAWV